MLLWGAMVLSTACTNDPPAATEACLAMLPPTCAPEVNPKYADIYANILATRCGGTSAGTGCHGAQGRRGNLGFNDIDEAYEELLGHGTGGQARVLPGDPECSVLMERLETDDTAKRMPYMAAQLSAGARCAIQQWIEAGAPR